MKVVLHADTEVLDEVVVTAYGTATKGTFTGSASVMKADKIEKRQVWYFYRIGFSNEGR